MELFINNKSGAPIYDHRLHVAPCGSDGILTVSAIAIAVRLRLRTRLTPG